MDSDQINIFTDSFNFEKKYLYSSSLNVFVFYGPKINCEKKLKYIHCDELDRRFAQGQF